MDLIRLYFSHCLDITLSALDGCSHLKSYAVLLGTPPSPLLDFSGAPIRGFRFQALLQPPSPTMSHHHRTYQNPQASYQGGVWVYFVTIQNTSICGTLSKEFDKPHHYVLPVNLMSIIAVHYLMFTVRFRKGLFLARYSLFYFWLLLSPILKAVHLFLLMMYNKICQYD